MLRGDPNFRRLPPAEQQRVVRQLHQVNQLSEAQRQRRLAAHQHQGRVAVLNRPGVASFVQVNDGERGVADFAHLAYRQRVHNRPRALADIHKRRGVAQRHRGRQIRQYASLDPAAQAVRQDGNDSPLGLDTAREEDIA